MLVHVARELNRYATHPVAVDASIASRPISGVFAIGATAAFAEVVHTLYPEIAMHRSPQGNDILGSPQH